MVVNRQWILARTPPEGLPTPDDFKFVESSMPVPKQTVCTPSSIVVKGITGA